MLIALPVAWATLFAVGALLVGDAGTAGPLIAGHSSVGSLLGGVLLAVAGAASLWVCLRVAREAMGLLRMQLGGLLALSHRGSAGTGRGVATAQSSSAYSLRRFGASVSRAAGGAAGQLAAAGPGGAAVVRAGRARRIRRAARRARHCSRGRPSRCGVRRPRRRATRGSVARRRRRRAHGKSRNRRLACQPEWRRRPTRRRRSRGQHARCPREVEPRVRPTPRQSNNPSRRRHLGDRCERKADRSSVDSTSGSRPG